jgi:hypothetical protein
MEADMPNFGKYAILSEITHQFEKEPDWWWKIKPPTSGSELYLSQFLSAERIVLLPGGARVSRPATNLEVAHREIALLFGGTNIPSDEGVILSPEATVEQVEAVLVTMPHEMVLEIWRAIGEACPGWGPVKAVPPAAKKEDESATKNS